MIERKPIIPARLRKIGGSFAYIEHRFLRAGFWTALSQHELLLYFFLVLVADRQGLSFYGYDKICTLLRFTLDDYILARDGLIDKDLVAFDGSLFQVLSLPERAAHGANPPLVDREDMNSSDPATICRILTAGLGEDHD